jgi:guanylate kinase
VNPFPLIISSPSGGGKTTISRLLLGRRKDVGYSVSCTTRPPRNGEIDTKDYFFVSKPEFVARRARRVRGIGRGTQNLYGATKRVERVLAQEQRVIMDIDVQGARQFRAAYPESVLVFLLPPSAEALMQRLTSRKTESGDGFRTRVRAAREELRAAVSYQYAVVNDDLESAYRVVSSIIDAEAVRHARQPQLTARVTALVEELDRHLFHLTSPAS